MKYSKELVSILDAVQPATKDDLLNVLKNMIYSDYHGFTRLWVTELITSVSNMDSTDFRSLMKGNQS